MGERSASSTISRLGYPYSVLFVVVHRLIDEIKGVHSTPSLSQIITSSTISAYVAPHVSDISGRCFSIFRGIRPHQLRTVLGVRPESEPRCESSHSSGLRIV